MKEKATAQRDQWENVAALEGVYSLDKMQMDQDFSNQIVKICRMASMLLLTG
jgi:hypothetical protein